MKQSTIKALEEIRGYGYVVDVKECSTFTLVRIIGETSEDGFYFFNPALDPARADKIMEDNEWMEGQIEKFLIYEKHMSERRTER